MTDQWERYFSYKRARNITVQCLEDRPIERLKRLSLGLILTYVVGCVTTHDI
jgi:hypothetical protein